MITGTAFWFASRATGVVSLVLFSVVTILGILVNRQGRLPGLPRFAVTGLHRNLSLLTVAFLGMHIITAIVDGYAHIPWLSTVVPFTSGYERLWIGLGTVAIDLFAAIIVTSLLRDRLKPALWRAVHLLAYLSYPVVVVHSLGASKDLRSGWLLALTMATVFGVVTAIGYRVVDALSATSRAGRVPEQLDRAEDSRVQAYPSPSKASQQPVRTDQPHVRADQPHRRADQPHVQTDKTRSRR